MQNALTRFGIPALLIIGAVAVLVALFSASRQSANSNGLERYARGSLIKLETGRDGAIPASQFETASGDKITLADFDDKTIVLNIWFEACPPCEVEMPSLAELARLTKDDGVEVVAVAVDRGYNRENNEKALAEWTDGGLDFYFDMSYGIVMDTGSRGMPTTIIYDRHGQEMARLEGEADWASEDALALVREIAAR